MKHPWQAIPAGRRAALFWLLAAAAGIMTVVMSILAAPLRAQPAAPSGIISFELAANATRTNAILASWDRTQQLQAAFSLGIDYLYIGVYGAAISLGCVGAAGPMTARRWRLARLGPWLAWGIWLAALCDGIENYALLHSLYGPVAAPWPQAAAACAAVKFALIAIGLSYTAAGGMAWLAEHVRRAPLQGTEAKGQG